MSLKHRAHELTEANKIARRDRCRKLLKRYPASMVNFCWFTDEKIFTVAAPNNSQNDRLYAPVAVRKEDVTANRLLRTRPTFSQSVMVSVNWCRHVDEQTFTLLIPALKCAIANHKFPNEYSDVIFVQIDQHLKMLLKKYKGVPILWNTV